MYEILGPLWSFFITSLISLFIIIDPPGNLFPYLALSAGLSREAARRLAGRACFYSFVILALFEVSGRFILGFFGIGLPAFQIAGGLILFRIAFDMLEGRGHFDRLDTSSSLVATDYRDIALVPLAMPLLSGPGAITTVLVLASRAQSPVEDAILLVSLLIVLLIIYICFAFAEWLISRVKESNVRLMTRIMGLILCALAVQFVLQGLLTAFPSLGQ